jgi:tungstate transport system permease protein
MDQITTALGHALRLISSGDQELATITWLSLRTAGLSTLLSTALGLPLGAALAIARFPGREILVATCNALLGMPSVVIGLIVYLALSRSGPLGFMGLLFTPAAMVIAQTTLITPMVIALARGQLEPAWLTLRDPLRSFRVGPARSVATLLYDCRFMLATIVLAAFGRAISEVGAVMTVGGNIAGATRVMTTAIALETSKGELALALGLGIVLVMLVLAVAFCAQALGRYAESHYG